MTYEKPKVVKLGSLTELTQTAHIKQFGAADGILLQTDSGLDPIGYVS